MNFKILKKDLKRKKSMNLILLIFVLLATTFIAGSLNNLLAVTSGLDYFLDLAQMGDYIFATMGGSKDELSENDQRAGSFLARQEHVSDYTIDDVLYISKNQLETENGKAIDFEAGLVNSCEIGQQKFFDSGNHLIEQMEEGTVYFSYRVFVENELEPGDKICIRTANGYEKTFRLEGYVKDAFLGSDMMGTDRIVLGGTDFADLLQNSGLPYGRLYSVQCDDLEAFKEAYSDLGMTAIASMDRTLVKTTYIMDTIVAAILLVVSFCLVIISVIMLRFTIIFTINEDYREIGIMKAIGVGERTIRQLYLSKYLVLAVIGAAAGFCVSIPFSRLLLAQVSARIILKGNAGSVGPQILASLLIVLIVVFFAWLATAGIRRFTPMDAIRSGNSGERFKRKGVFHLTGSRLRPTTFMAVNDILSELRKYIVVLVMAVVGVWLIVMPVNTINTLRSDNIAAWFSVTDCDFWIVDDERISELSIGRERAAYYEYLEELEGTMNRAGIETSSVVVETIMRLKIRNGEYSYNSLAFQGLRTDTEAYFYDEGMPPKYENEIAVTHIVAEKLHAGIGDTVYVTDNGVEKPYVITALYQSMNNMGEGIRFTEAADLDYMAVSGGFGIQVTLKESLSEKELRSVMDEVQKLFPEAKVKLAGEYIADMLGGVLEQLDFLKLFIFGLVIIINMLVVVLMQKMFLIRERGEMGMLKAVGFTDREIIVWQTKRIMLVLFLGILLGTLTGASFSQITAGQVFKIMGASRIAFEINRLETYVIYPAVIFVMTVLACVVTMRKVRNIAVRDVHNIE